MSFSAKELWPTKGCTGNQVDITSDIKFPATGAWPGADGDSLTDFSVDDDGWNNVYNDQVGEWYSFIESSSPPDAALTITGFYEDEYEQRQDVESDDHREFPSQHLSTAATTTSTTPLHQLTPIREEQYSPPVKQQMLSPAKKFRTSLSKLACGMHHPVGEMRDAAYDSPPVRLGAETKPSPLLPPPQDASDDSSGAPTPNEKKHYNWMHKTNLFQEKGMLMSKRELDRCCGTTGSTKITTKITSGRDDCSSRSGGSSSVASSIANCDIDVELAKALSFHHEDSPQKKVAQYGHPPRSFFAADNQVPVVASQESLKPITPKKSQKPAAGTTGSKVADRQKWLNAAFVKKSYEAEVEETKSEVGSKIRQFGGQRKTGVQRRREEWERKLAEKEAAKTDWASKLTLKTQWSCDNDGSYKRNVVLKPVE